jgi:hypothetical protein
MKQNLLVEVTVNGKEENSQDFRPNYVNEFGLWTQVFIFLDEPATESFTTGKLFAVNKLYNVHVHCTVHAL